MAATERPRPRCSVYIAVSIDGFIAKKDDSLDWLGVVQREGEDYGYEAFIETVDSLVIGRRTYDKVLGFGRWPYEGKRCVVLAHAPAQARHGEEFTDLTPSELVDRLGREGARRIYVDGGTVIRSFLAAHLIDDMTISVIPTVLGDGIPLFGPDLPEQAFVLDEAKPFPSGLVQARYTRSRAAA